MGPAGLSTVAALEIECASHHGRKHAVALGRGTWALALLLQAIESKVRRKILALPSFLCQTPLAGILHAGWQPLFVDVDPLTGLVPDSEWANAASMGVGAMMLVHLFGNPANPAFATELCREKNIFLIEDACQAVGGASGTRACGSFGDAAILSFGRTKSIDAGTGGMLLTDDGILAAAVRRQAELQAYIAADRYEALSATASRLFYERKDRLLDPVGDPADEMSGAIDAWRELVPAAWRADPGEILRQFAGLSQMVAERRRKWNLYSKLLAGTGIEPLRLAAGAVPWRYCFRMPHVARARKVSLVATLRAKGVHVSNWYVPTHWMSPQPCLRSGNLDGTLKLHAEIFQLWLDPATDDARIRADAAVFTDALTA